MLPAGEPSRRSPPRCDRYVTALNLDDVQLGRGRPVVTSEGNKRFRRLILDNKAEYTCSRRHVQKDGIARRVLRTVAERGGRFLRRLESTTERELLGIADGVQAWVIVDEETSLQKVKQALREQESRATADPTGSDTNLSVKKRKARVIDTPFPESALPLPGSNEGIASSTVELRRSPGPKTATASKPVVTQQDPSGGLLMRTYKIRAHTPDSNAGDDDGSPPQQEALDLLFRMKHPSLRKRDMSVLRREQQAASLDDDDQKVAARVTGDAQPRPSFLAMQSMGDQATGADGSGAVGSSNRMRAARAADTTIDIDRNIACFSDPRVDRNRLVLSVAHVGTKEQKPEASDDKDSKKEA